MIAPIDMLGLLEIAIQNNYGYVIVTNEDGVLIKITGMLVLNCDEKAGVEWKFEDIDGILYSPSEVSIRSIYDKRNA
jgi:hypothetical protein